MNSIPVFDENFPVRTVYTDKCDTLFYEECESDIKRHDNLEAYLSLRVDKIVEADETHSGSVLFVPDKKGDARIEITSEEIYLKKKGGYDAVVTGEKGILLGIWTADCLPVFLYDTVRNVAAICHCGWRGICNGILTNTINVMKDKFEVNNKDIIAAFGPCICGKCYEVTDEIRPCFEMNFSKEEIASFFIPGPKDKYLLDIKKAAKTELLRIGLSDKHIYDTDLCSYENKNYPSYRRDGRMTKHREMFSGIVLK